MRQLLGFGAFSSLINAASLLIFYTDALVIAAVLPVSMVTFYSIAGNLCEYARQLVSGMAIIMTPRVSALESRGNEALEGAILGAASVATLTTGAIVATYWFRGESFINLWMGREYGQTSGDLLRILGIVTLFGGARSIAVASIMGVNQHRILVPVWFL